MARVVGFFSLLLATASNAGDWPQFRGPNGSAASDDQKLPLVWTEGPSQSTNIKWKTPIAGIAWSSPIIWGGKLIVTTVVAETAPGKPRGGLYFGGERAAAPDVVHRWEIHCLDAATGKTLWKQRAAEAKPKTTVHEKNSYASETPATDGERIVAIMGPAGVFCFDMTGSPQWKLELPHYKTMAGWGMASSPILFDGKAYIQYDNQEKSFVLCLAAKSGKELWRADRKERSSWCTPLIWSNSRRTEFITNATNRIRSYDPATGDLLWELGGGSSIAVPSPTATRDLLYVGSGYIMDNNRPIFAVTPGGRGDLSLRPDETTGKNILWKQPKAGTYMPSPVLVGDKLYVLYDKGFFACHDAKTGKPFYTRKRLRSSGGLDFTASPVAYRDRIACLSEAGDTFVVKTGAEFEVDRVNKLDGNMFLATPALADGRLFIRSDSAVYCIQETGP